MSLLQEALKRKELDETQRKPEAGSTPEKPPAVLPPGDANLPAGRQDSGGQNTVIPQASPLQSMPVSAPPPSAASQPARQSLGAGGPIPAPARLAESAKRVELALGEAPLKTEPSRLGEALVAKPERRKISLLWAIVAVIVIMIGLTVAAGFAFFIYRCLPPMKAKISPPVYHIDKTDTMAAGGTNILIGQPIPAERRETADSAEAMTHPSVAPDVLVPKPQSEKDVEKDSIVTAVHTQAVAVMQDAELKSVQLQPAGDTERRPVPAKSGLGRGEPAKAKTPTASSPAVRWPALKLSGILRGSGPSESTAVINGKMISTGQTIDDVTILEIQADGVLLKHGAEKRFLRVGATLY